MSERILQVQDGRILLGRPYSCDHEAAAKSRDLAMHDDLISRDWRFRTEDGRGRSFLKIPVPGEGRTLAVDWHGDPNGIPFFLLHGSPGSKWGPRPAPMSLYRNSILLVTYDRPGYGGSDPNHDRSVDMSAADVTVIADALGFTEFGIVGQSGGGLHAQAAAALLGERIPWLGLIASPAPRDAPGLKQGKITADNQQLHTIAKMDTEALERRIAGDTRNLRLRAESLLLERLAEGMDAADQRFLFSRMAAVIRGHDTSLPSDEDQAWGWAADLIAQNMLPLGFDPRSIKARTFIWHGKRDKYVAFEDGEWLAQNIPGALLFADAYAAHFAASSAVLPIMKGLLYGDQIAWHDLADESYWTDPDLDNRPYGDFLYERLNSAQAAGSMSLHSTL